MSDKKVRDIRPRPRVTLVCPEPVITKQSMKDEVDINNIVERYNSTGLVTHVSSRTAAYGDVSTVPDYQAAMNVVIQANEMFDALPSAVRERFKNDPAQFLAFVGDEKNREEAEKLGLIEKKKVPDGPGPVPVPPAVPKPAAVDSGSSGGPQPKG